MRRIGSTCRTGPTHFLPLSLEGEDAHLIEEAVIGAMTLSGIDATSGPSKDAS